jgi:hypothetical protein
MTRQSVLVMCGGPGRPVNRLRAERLGLRPAGGPRSGKRQARDLRRSAASRFAAPGVAHKLGRVGKYVRTPLP